MARPPKYTPDTLEKEINTFFDELEAKEGKTNAPTLYDLADYLDIDRSTLFRYEQRDGYAKIMKRARNRIIGWWVRQLAIPGRPTTGVIFYLKNVAGWSDKREVQHNVKGQIEHTKEVQKLEDHQVERLNDALEALEDKENAIDVTDREDNDPSKATDEED